MIEPSPAGWFVLMCSGMPVRVTLDTVGWEPRCILTSPVGDPAAMVVCAAGAPTGELPAGVPPSGGVTTCVPRWAARELTVAASPAPLTSEASFAAFSNKLLADWGAIPGLTRGAATSPSPAADPSSEGLTAENAESLGELCGVPKAGEVAIGDGGVGFTASGVNTEAGRVGVVVEASLLGKGEAGAALRGTGWWK